LKLETKQQQKKNTLNLTTLQNFIFLFFILFEDDDDDPKLAESFFLLLQNEPRKIDNRNSFLGLLVSKRRKIKVCLILEIFFKKKDKSFSLLQLTTWPLLNFFVFYD
jgi:hypothetical protein